MLGGEAIDQPGIIHRARREGAMVRQGIVDDLAAHRDVAHLSVVDLVEEFGIAREICRSVIGLLLENVEQRHEQQADDDPKRQGSAKAVKHGARPFLLLESDDAPRGEKTRAGARPPPGGVTRLGEVGSRR